MLCAGFAEGKKDACKVGTGVGRARLGPAPWAPGGNQPTWDEDKAQEVGPQGPDQSYAFNQPGK